VRLGTLAGLAVSTMVGAPPSIDTVAIPQPLHLTPIHVTAVPVKLNVAVALASLEAKIVPPLKVPVSGPYCVHDEGAHGRKTRAQETKCKCGSARRASRGLVGGGKRWRDRKSLRVDRPLRIGGKRQDVVISKVFHGFLAVLLVKPSLYLRYVALPVQTTAPVGQP
jgi:hypothetical protein